LYPQFITPLVVSSITKTTISIAANVSRIGNIYCNAVETNSLLSAISIQSLQFPTNIFVAGNVTLRLLNLNPGTNYTVYCYTSSYSGQLMPVSEMMLSSLKVSTQCCKFIRQLQYYDSVLQYFVSSSMDEKQYQIALSSAPSSELKLNITTNHVDCGTRAVVKTIQGIVFPSAFSFSSSSTGLIGAFVVRSSAAACYNIMIKGARNHEYYQPLNFTVRVRNYRIPPSAPKLKSAIFASDGVSFIIEFDSPTDRGLNKIIDYEQSFNCSKILMFAGSNFASCKWVSDTMLVVIPRTTIHANVADSVVVFKGDVIRAKCEVTSDCDAYAYASKSTTSLFVSSNPLRPVTLLYAANYIPYCDSLTLDATGSYGHGSRPWKSLQWFVQNLYTGKDDTALQNFLNVNHTYSTGSVITVPNTFLKAGTSYFIQLQVINYHGVSDITGVSVEVLLPSAPIAPQVRIYGIQREHYSWQALSLTSGLLIPVCLGNVSANAFKHSWKLYRDYEFMGSVESTSPDPRFYNLVPYALQPMSSYRIILDVNYQTAKSRTFSTIAVGRSELVAIIAGGLNRVIGNMDSMILDASGSYDLDEQFRRQLIYKWSCFQTRPTYGASCPALFDTNSSIIVVSPGTFASVSYNISVLVVAWDGKSAIASTLVTVVTRNVPYIRLASLDSKYNVGKKIILSVFVSANTSSVRMIWSALSLATFGSSDRVLTPLSRDINMNSTSRVAVFQLAISPFTLVAGTTYTFRLQAAYLSTPTIFSSINFDILANTPPLNGILKVLPNVGTALITSFLLSTELWSDDVSDFPLRYSFAYQVQLNDVPTYIRVANPLPYVTSFLGQGLNGLSYMIQCIVIVEDLYESSNNATFDATVNPLQNTTKAVSLAKKSLSAAVSEQNSVALIQTISAVLSVLNAVDCSVVSTTYCRNLNRASCQSITNTCGSCLLGYIGSM
jgi:hypothetical protein